ncbi:Ku protein [Streptomyces sp. NPDC001617]
MSARSSPAGSARSPPRPRPCYGYAKDQVVPISDRELNNLPLPTAQAIEIAGFVSLESIDAIQICA